MNIPELFILNNVCDCVSCKFYLRDVQKMRLLLYYTSLWNVGIILKNWPQYKFFKSFYIHYHTVCFFITANHICANC